MRNILSICANPLKVIFLTFIASAVLSSCASTIKTRSVTTAEILHGGIIHKPVVADLAVSDTKVQGTSSGPYSQLEMLKNEAVTEALTKAGNADVLVEPNFSISIRGKYAQVEVSGYPATYKNFRSMEDDDKSWLDYVSEIHRIKSYDTTKKRTATSSEKKSGLFGF